VVKWFKTTCISKRTSVWEKAEASAIEQNISLFVTQGLLLCTGQIRLKKLLAEKSYFLSPNLHGLVIAQCTRCNNILGGMTCYWYNCICVTFQFLHYFPALKLPQVYTTILRTTNNVLSICYGKGGRNTEFCIDMPSVCLQKFPSWKIPKPLQVYHSRSRWEII